MLTTLGRTSLKRSYKIGTMGLCLIIFLIGTTSLMKLHMSTKLSNTIVDRSVNEMHHTMALRISAIQAAMPVNDYIIHASEGEKAAYPPLRDAVEQQFERVAAIASLDDAQREALLAARVQWNQSKEAADVILSIPDPIGNRFAADKMEQFDQFIDHSVEILSHLYDLVYAENMRRSEEIREIEFQTSLLDGALFLLALVLVIYASIWLPRSFFPPLRKVSRGMQAVTDGDLAYRVDKDVPIEFISLVDGFNAMADKLQSVQQAQEKADRKDA